MESREEKEKKLCDSYRAAFSSPDGKAVLDDLFARARVGNSAFDENPNISAYNQGWRDCIVYIIERIDYDQINALERFRRLMRSREEQR